MAANARTTGARTRAPEKQTAFLADKHAWDKALEDIRDLQSDAERIDAIVLGVTAMVEDQRDLERKLSRGGSLGECELWGGLETLLGLIRQHVMQIGERGEAVELTMLHGFPCHAAT